MPCQLYSVALIECTWPVQHHRCPSAVAVHGAETFYLTGKLFSLFVNTNLLKNVAFPCVLLDIKVYLAQQVTHYNVHSSDILPFFF